MTEGRNLAFDIVEGLVLVTFDSGFRQFEAEGLNLLLLATGKEVNTAVKEPHIND